jgi:hypothetical protein
MSARETIAFVGMGRVGLASAQRAFGPRGGVVTVLLGFVLAKAHSGETFPLSRASRIYRSAASSRMSASCSASSTSPTGPAKDASDDDDDPASSAVALDEPAKRADPGGALPSAMAPTAWSAPPLDEPLDEPPKEPLVKATPPNMAARISAFAASYSEEHERGGRGG